MTRKPSVGIALDSGGVRGGAHMGVMDVLAENSIPIDFIAGSSAGALIGAVYAAGRQNQLKGIISDMSMLESFSYYLDPVLPITSLLSGDRARAFIGSILGDVTFEELQTQLTVVTTDLLTGEPFPISSGPVADAVMASISIPGIFKPVVHGDRMLTDGGVSNPLPLDILKKQGPDITIACNLHPRLSNWFNQNRRRAIISDEKRILEDEEPLSSWLAARILNIPGTQVMFNSIKPVMASFKAKIPPTGNSDKEQDTLGRIQENLRERINSLLNSTFQKNENALNIFEIMITATNIQQYQKNRLMLAYEQPDILIAPDVLEMGSLEFSRITETIDEGRTKALAAIPEIKKLIADWQN